ncbi:PIN domain-containing protein [Patescibacteria group bacterium]|nr:PIN domain-containing protein [Patescibacteria group bacterium]
MIIIDTSALIRFFTKDDLDKGEQVKALFEDKEKITIPEVVFPELEYVLTSQYQAKREDLIKAFNYLAANKNVKLTKQAREAIEIFHSTKLDMADSLIAAHSMGKKLAGFDKKMLNLKGVKSFWK